MHYLFHTIRRRVRTSVTALVVITVCFFVFHLRISINAEPSKIAGTNATPKRPIPDASQFRSQSTVGVVVASQSNENTSWIANAFPEWEKYIYVVDDPRAKFTVANNKGREAMVYLTYMIDHYDILPDVIIFQHANRYQWHNDDPEYDGLRLLSQLRIPYVLNRGYTNLRCVWTTGCYPDGIYIEDLQAVHHPWRRSDHPDIHARQEPPNEDLLRLPPSLRPPSHNEGEAESPPMPMHVIPGLRRDAFWRQAFQGILPHDEAPGVIEAPCCAQFAVTAATVWSRKKEEYERMRTWLNTTSMADVISGRAMEYFWHIIFGRPASDCPPAKECYCNLYGLCNLQCESEGVCEEQYEQPLPGVDFLSPKGGGDAGKM